LIQTSDGLGFVSEPAFQAGVVLHMDRSQFCYVAVHVKVAFHVIANSTFRIGSRLAQADEATRRLIDHWVSKG